MTDYSQYIKDATRTESIINEEEFSIPSFVLYLKLAVAVGNILDTYKRTIFYRKPLDQDKLKFAHEQAQEILSAANKMTDETCLNINSRFLHAVIGLSTESSELIESVLNSQVENIDITNVAEELGDLNWYQAIAIDQLGLDIDEILLKNISKLKARFPDKFSSENAFRRNLDVERQILEGKDSTE